jgi:hypothetical protein
LNKLTTAALGVRASLILEAAENDAKTSGQERAASDNALSKEAVQLLHGFHTLCADNQRVLMEIAKVLNKAQNR